MNIINNWRKPANKLISDTANILILLNAGVIPSVLSLPISDSYKIWIIGGYNLFASLINFIKKFTRSKSIEDINLINKQ